MSAVIGAILGDISGSTHEGYGTEDLTAPVFDTRSTYTDDTVLTLACVKAIHTNLDFAYWYRTFANRNLFCGYGGHFILWMENPSMGAYNSFGNGSAMRCSYCGQIATSLQMAEELAVLSALPTHDHEEGIKGAKVLAGCVFLARYGDKEKILQYAAEYYPQGTYRNYALRPLSDYKTMQDVQFDVTCQGCVPLAVRIFYEFDDFTKMMQYINQYSWDTDTLGAIAGAIFAAFYGHCIGPGEDDRIIVDALSSKRVPIDENELVEAYQLSKQVPTLHPQLIHDMYQNYIMPKLRPTSMFRLRFTPKGWS